MSFAVFLVDDDPSVLAALSRMIRASGYESRGFLSPRDFLREHDPAVPGCVVLDLAMPDVDGLELQQRLTQAGVGRPIIFLSGRADIPASVRAMKAGAIDFLVKPVRRDDLLSAIARAEERDAAARAAADKQKSVNSRLSRLTPRERQVLDHVVLGSLNKQIAATLGTVEKTIKVHRGRMMTKMEVRSVAELVHLVEQAGVRPQSLQDR
jgi:FixJ family two-component response regulator